VSFEGWKLEDVLDLLRRSARINLVVSARAREALRREQPAIVMQVTNLRVVDVLDLLGLQLDRYRFTIRHGVVLLVCADEYRPATSLRVYDVRDIVQGRRDFPAPVVGGWRLETEGRR
jgi:hypothetical protein